jgi:hypothetical protein
MKVGIGTEAVQLHFWEYINLIFFAVWKNANCLPQDMTNKRKEKKNQAKFFFKSGQTSSRCCLLRRTKDEIV